MEKTINIFQNGINYVNYGKVSIAEYRLRQGKSA